MDPDVFYLGQCVDWTFTFTLPAGVSSIEDYDEVLIHFACGTVKKTVTPDSFPTATTAAFHNDVDFLSRTGVWKAQAWAAQGAHRTPSLEVRAFTVIDGVPAES